MMKQFYQKKEELFNRILLVVIVSILNKIFTGSQCRTISDGHTYTCTDGSYNGDTKTNGYTSLHYETSCTIYGSNSNTGKLICH
jgi:hypothetical protein